VSAELWTADRIAEADRRYVIHSWSTQGAIKPKVITGGEGSWFWDADGRRYLDFQSQLVNMNLGHQHPRLVEAIADAARDLCYMGPGFAVRSRAELAERLAALAPGDLEMTFFTTGGAEANESAIRLARHVTGRPKVIARYRSYHGATAGALQLTGDERRWAGEPFVSGVVRMLEPDPYRRPADDPVNLGRPHLEEILAGEGPQNVAAIIVEPVTGTNGMLYPPDGYLQALREVCDEHGILLVFDEVMVGFGRTGTMFASEHWDVVPDVMTTAKGLNSGYVPLGAMTVSSAIGDWLQDHKFWAGQTYAGHPLACASGVASLEIMESEDVLGRLAPVAEHLAARLQALADTHPSIGDVRGRGAFYGIELVADRMTKAPLAGVVPTVCAAAMQEGLYLTGNANVLRIAPPLVVTREEVDLAVDILDSVLSLADAELEAAA